MSEGEAPARSPEPLGRRPGERWTRVITRIANAFGLVVLLVLTTYVFASLIPYNSWPALVIVAACTGSAVVGLASAEAKPLIVHGATVVAVIALVLAASGRIADSPTPLAFASLIQAVLLLTAAGAVLRAVISEPEVGFRTILGAVSVYLMLGLLFTFLFAGVDRLQDGLYFGRPTETGDFVFFSFTTLTTTGYGNLVPVAQPGKMLSGLEMLIGQIFLVTLIARLVSMWRPGTWLRGRS